MGLEAVIRDSYSGDCVRRRSVALGLAPIPHSSIGQTQASGQWHEIGLHIFHTGNLGDLIDDVAF